MPEPHQDRNKAFSETQNPETFVRHTLGIIEENLRVFALLSLQEWASTGITEKDLFVMLGRLQNPSWGDWNELLITLRKLHKETGVIKGVGNTSFMQHVNFSNNSPTPHSL